MFAIKPSYTATALKQSVRAFHVTRSAKIVTEVASKDAFRDTVLKSPIAFVDAYAVWCGPCKMIAPYIEKFSDVYKTVDFYKFDVEGIPELSHEYGISAMPTFLVFKQGKVVDKIIGANPQGIQNALKNATESN